MKRIRAKTVLERAAIVGVVVAVLTAGPVSAASGQATTAGATAAAAQAANPSEAPGTPFSADRLASLLPSSVYFAGRTAPLQTRNAGGTRFADGAIVWVSLVDSSGYASSVQERYQFYLVSEGSLRFGDVTLKAGAYGGGFVGDHFVLMDLGDHSIGEGPTQTDAGLRRPRPLQVVAFEPNAVKLYLGRRWVLLRAQP